MPRFAEQIIHYLDMFRHGDADDAFHATERETEEFRRSLENAIDQVEQGIHEA